MADGSAEACWCTRLPPVVPLPGANSQAAGAPAGCWCPACLEQHIALLEAASPATSGK
jgi:hypothetical protein